MHVMLPGTAKSVKANVPPFVSSKEFYAELRKDPDHKRVLATLDISNLEVRVMWKAEHGELSTKVALGAPAVNVKFPLLEQVHVINADGSVSADAVTWSSLVGRGGYFYVHVKDTTEEWLMGALRTATRHRMARCIVHGLLHRPACALA
ncbi:MAG: hypothetical protein EOO65_03235 [Methanosarcinales archaeon]|nr:MAG: hypothetical protein EOO65_03235 [Methanosarcinales archaeon]